MFAFVDAYFLIALSQLLHHGDIAFVGKQFHAQHASIRNLLFPPYTTYHQIVGNQLKQSRTANRLQIFTAGDQ